MRKLIGSAFVFFTFVVWGSSFADAGGRDSDSPVEIGVEVGDVGSAPVVTPVVPEPRYCLWTGVAATPGEADWFNTFNRLGVSVTSDVGDGDGAGTLYVVTVTYFSDGGVLGRWNDIAGRFERNEVADCDDATVAGGYETGDVRWVPTGPPDPRILLDRTVIARKNIFPPVPVLSPPSRVPVNLGLWLAVEPQASVTVRAELGPVWAERSASVVSTSFDMGNGDVVECVGVGDRIPDWALDTFDQSPVCGYTYTRVADLDVGEVTVTVRWAIVWRLSSGESGVDAEIDLVTGLPYEVYEIQTIGARP